MKLSQLLDKSEGTETSPCAAKPNLTTTFDAPNPDITFLTSDSRKIKPGALFAALPGTDIDGRTFIDDALARGAVAILAPEGTPAPQKHDKPVAFVTDANPRQSFSRMAAVFYSHQPDFIAAVTGTNGKTSVVNFCQQLWLQAGINGASMGTLGVIKGDSSDNTCFANAMTTPDPVILHQCLDTLAQEEVHCLALEASSHGLHQARLDGLRISAAAFTNLTQEHLDYHGTMESYLFSPKILWYGLS